MSEKLGILGRKVGMTRIFNSDGTAIPCTVIAAGPCPVVQVKNLEKDGYNALQIGYGDKKAARVSKPDQGHMQKAGKGFFEALSELRVDSVDGYEVGQELTVEMFTMGERVKVTGTSKGKGFQGAMKRWNFGGSPASHGHEKVHRSTGSVGHATHPGRIFKGKKMPGQMGNKRITAMNLEVVDVRPEHNLVFVRGAVPGPKNGLVVVRKK